jgi:NDP-sugar pyrophosphorylase family protein
VRAVILAGGRGTRLAPYTTVFPKPLMPVGDMPILEILVRQLCQAGVTRLTLAVGHLAGLLQAYFGDGDRFGVPIDYSLEDEPLGTAAPLRLVPGLDDTFLVMNGDLLTDLDFAAFVSAHLRGGAAMSVGAYQRDVRIDLGVLDVDPNNLITRYTEKPTYSFLVSMGVYVMEPSVLRHIPEQEPFDLPDLVRSVLGAGDVARVHLHNGYWLDIGRPDDYERAQADVDGLRTRLLAPPAETRRP